MANTINSASVGLTDKERLGLWENLEKNYGVSDSRAALLRFAAYLEQEVIDNVIKLQESAKQ